MTWDDLFGRAAAFSVTETDIRAALDEQREQDAQDA